MTLVETVMALVITGVVIASTMSAIEIVLGGAALMESRASSGNAISLAMLRIRNEFRFATTITELTGHSITFTISDLTGDAIDDTVRYHWSETLGDPLTREVNGEGAAPLLDDCTQFDLQADIDDLVASDESGWGDEVLVAVHDGYPPEYSQGASTVNVHRSYWVGFFFEPWQDGATSCRITRALISMGRDYWSRYGSLQVSIRPTGDDGYWPSSEIYDQVKISIIDLPTTQQFREVMFPDMPRVAVGRGVTLVVIGDSDDPARIGYGYLSNGGYDDGTCLFVTSNRGGSWAPSGYHDWYDLRSYIYGQFNSGDSDVVESGKVRNLMVSVSAKPGEETVSAEATVNCMNRPPMAALPVAELPARMSR